MKDDEPQKTTGERDLQKLIRELSPSLNPDLYVFCTVKDALYEDIVQAHPIATFIEEEGLTLVLKQHVADAQGLVYQSTFRCITLKVHSSLTAIGLTAVVATALAKKGISANMMAGYFHDHVFVPANQAMLAMQQLESLSKEF